MTVFTGAQAYTQSTGTSTLPFVVVLDVAPGTHNTQYPLGQFAIVPSANTSYQLTSFSSSGGKLKATWTEIT